MSCIGCKVCVRTCPEPNTTRFIKSKRKVVIDPQRCKGCGLCVVICPIGCIKLAHV
ncbi:MAG: 4Fe-4S binding protein [Desulfotomaculum sp.]|nr:4Fe-4S binding protein [Desulfotomaculum sp.]